MLLTYYRIMAASLFIFTVTECAPELAKARQYIESFPGFVPVYIRRGDTPLQEINPELAEAFSFNAQKHGRIAFGRQINEIIAENSKKSTTSTLENLEKELELENENVISPTSSPNEFQHIQKIPKS